MGNKKRGHGRKLEEWEKQRDWEVKKINLYPNAWEERCVEPGLGCAKGEAQV